MKVPIPRTVRNITRGINNPRNACQMTRLALVCRVRKEVLIEEGVKFSVDVFQKEVLDSLITGELHHESCNGHMPDVVKERAALYVVEDEVFPIMLPLIIVEQN
jgi:hypothetical protein